MTIVHVAPTAFGPDGLLGGGERYPVALARALARHVPCRLVTFGARATRHPDPSGLEVVVLKRLFMIKGHPAHPVASGLARAVRDAAVVHTHQMRSTPSRMAALAAAVVRRPTVVTDHGLGGGGWGGALPRLFDRFLVVSRFSAATLGAPENKTRVIFGGADPTRFSPADDVGDDVLFVGRITPHKGLDVLINALPEEARLVIAGSIGHDRRPPERYYPDLLRRSAGGKDVRFLGPVTEADLPDLYRSARVVVLPSVERTCYGRRVAISELLGLTLLEAMASGVPVVCSRVGGLPEVVADGDTGYIVEPGDVDALRARLAELLGDRPRARSVGRAGRARVLDEFTWERCAERCLAAYEELDRPAA